MAKDFFDSEVTMTILNQSEEDERTGKKEHVVFLVKQQKRSAALVVEKGQRRAKDPQQVRRSCSIWGGM